VSDYNIFIRGRSKVFLGGPPLVKMATGEDSDDEELGGAEMRATMSGLADYLASQNNVVPRPPWPPRAPNMSDNYGYRPLFVRNPTSLARPDLTFGTFRSFMQTWREIGPTTRGARPWRRGPPA